VSGYVVSNISWNNEVFILRKACTVIQYIYCYFDVL